MSSAGSATTMAQIPFATSCASTTTSSSTTARSRGGSTTARAIPSPESRRAATRRMAAVPALTARPTARSRPFSRSEMSCGGRGTSRAPTRFGTSCATSSKSSSTTGRRRGGSTTARLERAAADPGGRAASGLPAAVVPAIRILARPDTTTRGQRTTRLCWARPRGATSTSSSVAVSRPSSAVSLKKRMLCWRSSSQWASRSMTAARPGAPMAAASTSGRTAGWAGRCARASTRRWCSP
mmetsp:Transcript_36395/g.116903  ORF Transcript_36395/g.116903 Transcript_36395/m.116903 type:complete len:239 (-) Transcript_36395:686-1402(-)